MPRAIWSGTISFGLVSAPVKMYSAIAEHSLELHLVHEKDGSRIGYEKVCKKEGKEVPDDEIVKAYELNGKLVYLTDDDFAAAEEDAYRTIEILEFVPHEEIDPIVFARTYFLGPDQGSEKVYALLVKAMGESGLAGIASYVFRNRQQLGCLRVREGVLTLENLYFADEIRPSKGIAPKGVKVGKDELDMATALIDRFTKSRFDHGKYEDEYRKQLLSVVRKKARGKEVTPAPREEPEEPPDLMEALRESVAAAKKARGARRQARRNGGAKRKGRRPRSRS
jgi:DNA end-binding protein Ku